MVIGGASSALALVGLVVFATEASAHNNYVTPTASCNTPLGSGATLNWVITNDYPLSETGTASTNANVPLSSSTFSIAASPHYPNNVSTATLSQSFTGAELATQIVSSPTITFHWSATWSDNFKLSGTSTYDLARLPSECKPTPSSTPTTITTQQSASSSGQGTIVLGGSVTDTATVTSTAGTPTGTVAFTECGPTSSAQPCSSGTAVGSAVPLTNGTATSAGFTPTQVGTYCFAAVYTPTSGSGFSSSQDNTSAANASSAECFSVTAAVTPVVTTPPVSTSPSQTTPTATTPAPTTSPAATSSATGAGTAVTTSPTIAFTGARLELEWILGLALTMLGAVLILTSRRRRPQHAGRE
jgi:hypothetical protein